MRAQRRTHAEPKKNSPLTADKPHTVSLTHAHLDSQSSVVLSVVLVSLMLLTNDSPIERGHRWSHVSRPLLQDSQQTPQLWVQNADWFDFQDIVKGLGNLLDNVIILKSLS